MELASKMGVEKMDRLVNDALSKGAKRLTVDSVADKKVQDGANAYIPVILDNVKPDQDIYYQGKPRISHRLPIQCSNVRECRNVRSRVCDHSS